MKEVLFKKGYHLEVESWENDADNYRTKTLFVGDNEEHARALLKMCKELFNTYHDGDCKGIGNMMNDDWKEATIKIQSYLAENNDVFEALSDYYTEPIDIEDDVWDTVGANFNYEIMGGSEWYCSRVFDNGRIIYAPEDIKVEVIQKESRR